MPAEMVLVYTAAGQVEANLIKSLLEAHGIAVVSLQEGAGEAFGLMVGVLGKVELWVPAGKRAEAAALIRQLREGGPDEEAGSA